MPPPEENSNKRNKMLLVRQYTDSFSKIDWGGLGGSTRRSIPRQQFPRDFSVSSIDIPSMDDEGVASSGREKKKKGSKRRLSVTFAVNDEMIDNSCHEDIMEDGQRIGAENSATMSPKSTSSSKSTSSRSWSWCLAFTLLGIVLGAVVCFITFPPNTATLNWKKAMSGMRDWKSSSNNNSVVQQQLLQQQGRGQEMLELAEQITAACGESSSSSTGTSTCQELCSQHMCCVEQDDEYSCKSDVMKDCGVYAGCMALIDDSYFGERQD